MRAAEPRAVRDRLRRTAGVTRATLFGDAIHVTLAPDAPSWTAVVAGLRDAGVVVLEDGPTEPSLEDIFMELGSPTAEAGTP